MIVQIANLLEFIHFGVIIVVDVIVGCTNGNIIMKLTLFMAEYSTVFFGLS
jgi:hypothetical protein